MSKREKRYGAYTGDELIKSTKTKLVEGDPTNPLHVLLYSHNIKAMSGTHVVIWPADDNGNRYEWETAADLGSARALCWRQVNDQ